MSVLPDYFGLDGFTFPPTEPDDYPSPANVAFGVVYGNGVYTGTLRYGGDGSNNSIRRHLLHSPAQIYQQVLVDLGLAVAPLESTNDDGAWTVYATSLPDAPDNVVSIYDTAPKDMSRASVTRERSEHYGLQFLVRASNHPTGYRKSNDLARALDELVLNTSVTMTTPSATYFIKNAVRKGINYLGKDTPRSKRVLFTINATSAMRRTS